MLLDELKTPFRWYSDADKLLRSRDECKSFQYKLITPYDKLLPFMMRFIADASPHFPTSFKIYNAETGVEFFSANVSYLEYYSVGQYDYVVYKGGAITGLDMPTGFYYAIILMDTFITMYSENFYVDCDTEGRETLGDYSDDFNDDFGPPGTAGGALRKFTKLEWWNDCDLGNILYQTGYRNVLYFESDLVRDVPEILEEGSEDGKKDFIPSFIKYIDKIRFDDYVPEHIVTALLLVKLHKNVWVTSKVDLYTGKAKNFLCEFSWQNDCYARIDCSFLQETTFLRANCCYNNSLVDYNACALEMSNVEVTYPGSGFHLGWNVLAGSPPIFTIQSDAISGGAPFDVTTEFYLSAGPWPSCHSISGTVKTKCVNALNGVVTYGPAMPWTANIPARCKSYEVENPLQAVIIEYRDCNCNQQSQAMLAGGGFAFCAAEGTVTSDSPPADWTLTLIGDCTP